MIGRRVHWWEHDASLAVGEGGADKKVLLDVLREIGFQDRPGEGLVPESPGRRLQLPSV
jgi:hypothetical protein